MSHLAGAFEGRRPVQGLLQILADGKTSMAPDDRDVRALIEGLSKKPARRKLNA